MPVTDTSDALIAELRGRIHDVPDWPKPGIIFKDLTPLLADGRLLRELTAALIAPFRDQGVTQVAGMEARGFIFGALAAQALGVGFVPLRKPGKLPRATHQQGYALEYGEASLEVHTDALGPRDRVLLIDDLLATGGTAAASVSLVTRTGATLLGLGFVVELAFLDGRQRLGNVPVHALLTY